MKANFFFLALLGTLPMMAQVKDSTAAAAAGKAIADKFPATRVFDLQYDQFGPADNTTKVFGDDYEKGEIKNHYRIKLAANIILYKAKSQRFFITNSFRYKYEFFSFGNVQNATSTFTRPDAGFHYFANSLSATYFSRLFKKNVIYNASATVDADQYNFQRVKGMVSAVLVMKKTERTTFTLGALVTIDPSSIIPFVPIATYEYQFKNSPWKLDIILPQRFLLKRPLRENGRLSLGTELSSENFYLNLDNSLFKGTYELNQLGLRSGITYEYAIHKSLVGTFKTGITHVLSSRITERGERTNRYVIENRQDPQFYLMLACHTTLFKPSVFYFLPMQNLDHILILKTDIATTEEAGLLELVFSNHPEIEQWSIDLEDTDRVLRIVSPTLACAEVVALLEPCGFYCCELE